MGSPFSLQCFVKSFAGDACFFGNIGHTKRTSNITRCHGNIFGFTIFKGGFKTSAKWLEPASSNVCMAVPYPCRQQGFPLSKDTEFPMKRK